MKQREGYDRTAVGKRLRTRRKELGWSRDFVARKIGLGEKYYGDIERGYCGMSVETLLALSRLMGFTMDGLINGQQEERKTLDEEALLLKNLDNLPKEAQNCCIQMLLLFMEGLEATADSTGRVG